MLKTRLLAVVHQASVMWLGLAAVHTLTAAESRPGAGDYPPSVQPASDEGELALKRFRVAKGLRVELAAAEPLLANPVAFTLDEQGRFFVVETFRLHAGVTDIRGHMDWLDEELASRSVEERIEYVTKHEGRRIDRYKQHSDRLRLLWDSDGDGRADQATVFADGFNGVADGLAAGVLARKGDIYFANIPNLWLLRDTKGLGTADFRKSLSYGYGIRMGFIGHDLHGLRFGPDGRLYFSIGDRGAYVRTKGKGAKVVENRETGAVYRCDPDGSNLEIFATGLRNPQELAFDQFGNLWTGDNNSDGGDPARWVYVVEGGDSGWRIGWQFINSPNARGPWLAERLCYPQFDGQAAYILPPIANIGNGPSGLAYHPGTGLNDQFKDRFFLCDFRGGTGSGIHSIGVKPKGAGFEVTERSDFIWDVLVTDGDFGYDGCFYLTDWVNGWNQTGKGRIYRVFDPESRHSPLVQGAKKLFAEGFDQRPLAELAGLLAHPDQRVRQEAHFALAARDGALPVLIDLLKQGPPPSAAAFGADVTRLQPRLARLHAIWALGQMARQSSRGIDALMPFITDADPEVRAQTAKVLGDARAVRAYDGLVFLLRDPEPRVRFFAAIALSKVGLPEANDAAIEMVRRSDNQDPYLRHAGIMAMTALADPAGLEKLATDKSPAVRLAAVVALRRQARAGVAAFLKDKEPAIVLEAARAINDLPIPAALPKLAALIDDTALLERQEEASRKQREAMAARKNPKKPDPGAEPDVLFTPLLRRIVNAHFRLGGEKNASSLVAFSMSTSAPVSLRAEAVASLGEWPKPSGRDPVTGLWRPLDKRDADLAAKPFQKSVNSLLRESPAPVKVAAIKVATRLGIKEVADTAFTLVADDRQRAEVRREALRSLSALKAARLPDAVQAGLAASDEAVRSEAARIQAQLKPADAVAGLRTTLERGSVGEKQAALATLASLPGTDADAILGQWLDKLLAGNVSLELQLDLLDAAARRSDRDVKDRLTRFERSRPTDDEMRAYRECLQGGNLEEGKKIFLEKQEVFCVRCHKAGGDGGEVGPDLSRLAATRSREYILESIVYPNKTIAPGFESLVLTMNNGAVHAGILKSETDGEIELNSPEDGLLKLKKSEIKTRERGLSAMPEEARQILTKRELRDLVEFLSSLK